MGRVLESRALNLTLDFCLRVGEMLLSSGAGAADVTATMRSLSYHLGVRYPDIDVTFTSLSMSFQPSPEDPPLIHSRQVKQREIDYEDLTLVDHLVRDVLADRVDLMEARTALARIVSSGHNQPRWAVTLGWGVMCAGVGLQLGGKPTVIAIAFLAAVCIDRAQMVMSRRRLPFFYQQVAGGAIATILGASAAGLGLVGNPSLVVSANIIMLLAGIGFMGALQDALSGFYITGGARLTEAMLSTAGIIAGVSGGLTLAQMAGVQVHRLNPGAYGSVKAVSLMALGAAICAAAFAFASYAPRRIIAPIALIAAAAMVISQTLSLSEAGRTWPTGLAAFFVGLVSYTVAGRMRVPPLVVVVLRRGADAARPVDLPRPVAARRGPARDLRGPAGDHHRGLDRHRGLLRGDPRGVRRPAGPARGPEAREPARRPPPGRPAAGAHRPAGPPRAAPGPAGRRRGGRRAASPAAGRRRGLTAGRVSVP